MKLEELTKLGISEDIAKQVVSLSEQELAAEKSKLTDKTAELTMAEDKIKELTETVKKFDGVDVDKLKAACDNTDKGFVYDKGSSDKIDTVYIFEAPIDLMSFVELHPEIENAKFVALSGLKPSIIESYINSDLKVVSCVDNDAAGINFNNRILFQKMQESLDAGDNLQSHTVINIV